MSERKPAPVAPYLAVHDGNGALDFYKRAFGAVVAETYPYEGKLGHATLLINGGEVMMSDEFPVEMTGVRAPKSLGGTTTTISLAVDDADVWFDRAVAAGAKVLRPLNDEFYGRMGKIIDPYGHCWSIVGPAKAK
ncbi:VOC family protein [Pendulispora albinea]|uniref:VOC family protein n=1 Tax=Pendulispora albinea TaxID=2741071 RepID=A0ABZ2LUN3_9BACT